MNIYFGMMEPNNMLTKRCDPIWMKEVKKEEKYSNHRKWILEEDL